MSCDNQINKTDLENAKLDAITLGEIATSKQGSTSGGANIDRSTNRFGNISDTVTGRLKKMGYLVPVLYTSGIVFSANDNVKTVDESGVVCAPLPSALPFTTTTWGADSAKFFVIQGLTKDQLPAELISDLSQAHEFATVAEMTASNIVFPVGKKLNTIVNNTTSNAGGASYIVSSTAVADGYGNHALSGGNVAELIINNIFKPFQWGAIGDGVTDDKTIIDLINDTGKRVDLQGESYHYSGTFAPLATIENGIVIDANQSLAFYGLYMSDLISTGSKDAKSIQAGANYNLIKTGDSSAIFGGTKNNPHAVGYETYRFTETGDGVKVSFSISTPFVVNDLDRFNVRANKVRSSDGVFFDYLEGSGFSVSGYGTSNITITMDTAPTATEELEVTIIGENESVTSVSSLNQIMGYDNSSESIMTNILSAHCFSYEGGGHNAIIGGSFHRVGGSYCGGLGGRYNRLGMRDSNSFVCIAFGSSNQVDGASSMALGTNNDVNGVSSFAIGRANICDHNDNVIIGSGGRSFSNGELVLSGVPELELERGLYQERSVILNLNTADSSIGTFTNAGGASTIDLPLKSSAIVRSDVSCVDDTGSKMMAFSGNFLVSKDSGGTSLVNGLATDVQIPEISKVGTQTCTAVMRAISGGIRVRATGEAGANVRWVAKLTIVQTFQV